MDNEKLNEKLARWAGWTNVDFWHGAFWGTPPKQSQGEWLPDFTSDLTACFKWLVPKLFKDCGVIDISFGRMGYCCLDFGYGKEEIMEGGEPALSLCLAILKLIEDKDNASDK